MRGMVSHEECACTWIAVAIITVVWLTVCVIVSSDVLALDELVGYESRIGHVHNEICTLYHIIYSAVCTHMYM